MTHSIEYLKYIFDMLSEQKYVGDSPTNDTEAIKTHPDISSLLYLCESCNFGIYDAFTALYVQFTPDISSFLLPGFTPLHAFYYHGLVTV